MLLLVPLELELSCGMVLLLMPAPAQERVRARRQAPVWLRVQEQTRRLGPRREQRAARACLLESGTDAATDGQSR